MMRYMVPTFGLIAAMLVLFAGAYGDLPQWRREVPELISGLRQPAFTPEAEATAHPAPAPVPAADPDRARLAQQDADLKARIEQETKDLAALHASADQARRDLDALRARVEQEQAALARDAAARSAATASAVPPAAPVAAPVPPAVAAAVPPQQRLLASRRLIAARAALHSGRPARARWLLNLTRVQMTHWHGASAPADDTPEAQVEGALGAVARGDSAAATRSIEQALAALGGDTPAASG